MKFDILLSRSGWVYGLFFLSFLLVSCTSATQKNSHNASDSAASLSELGTEEQKLLVNKSPAELVALGHIYLENRNLGLAKLHFGTALEKQPDFAAAYVGLGKINMHSGNYPEALALFTRAAEIDKTLVDAMVGQAQALRFDGKMDTAVKKVNDAMSLSPNNILVLKELAILYDLMGQENLAEPLYQEVIRIAPDFAANHNNLGMNQLVQRKYPEAILSFLQALNINRESVRIKNNLATAYALRGDKEKALKLFTDTLGEAAAHNNLGYLYMTQGKFDLAEEHLKKAIATHPKFYPKAQDNLDRLKQARRAQTEK